MKVTLLHNTPLWVCARAIRTCWDSHDKSDTQFYDIPLNEIYYGAYENPFDFDIIQEGICGEKDKELIERVGNKNKHSSTLEHLCYSFEIDGISRACLQELARHRMASYSVKSSRYTLKELKDENFEFDFCYGERLTGYSEAKLAKYFKIDGLSHRAICSLCEVIYELQKALKEGKSNDVIKYMLPECFKTRLVWTINARSLQNFLSLRTSRSALAEIRELAYNVFNAIPEDHKYLFKDFLADSANIKDN